MIEETLGKLTEALNRNSDLLEKVLSAGRQQAAAGRPESPGKSADAPGHNKDEAGKPAKPAKPAKADKVKGPTETDLRGAFGNYMSVENKGEREERRANVKAILDHFGVAKATEIPEESRADAIAYVNAFAAGQTPSFMQDDEAADDDEAEESLV